VFAAGDVGLTIEVKAKRQTIEAAVVQADRDAFVSSQATRAWLANLGTENEQPRPEPDVVVSGK